MRILLLAPAFPPEMPLFAKALVGLGAEVIGVGESAGDALPQELAGLRDYWRVPSLWREDDVLREILPKARKAGIERVECLWEPGVLLAARFREELGLDGFHVAEALPFRDKGRMKEILDDAGIRTPRHERARTESAVWAAVERIGYPLIVKPIAGAGSLDTHRVEDEAALAGALAQLRHVPEVSVEEYIDGEEYTYDTICAGGEVLFENVAWYRPKVLVARTEEWISPQTVTLRDLSTEAPRQAREMGRAVLRALGFRDGFTHMEWFLRPDRTAVFGEIACRPPGARSVDVMVQCTDTDLYRSFGEAILHGRLSAPIERKYNAIVVFKRAHGAGRIARIEGLDGIRQRYAPHLVGVDLLPIGAPRRNWKQTLLSDGWITLRHPDLDRALEIGDAVAREVRLFAE